jgi:hypothetical protein
MKPSPRTSTRTAGRRAHPESIVNCTRVQITEPFSYMQEEVSYSTAAHVRRVGQDRERLRVHTPSCRDELQVCHHANGPFVSNSFLQNGQYLDEVWATLTNESVSPLARRAALWAVVLYPPNHGASDA